LELGNGLCIGQDITNNNPPQGRQIQDSHASLLTSLFSLLFFFSCSFLFLFRTHGLAVFFRSLFPTTSLFPFYLFYCHSLSLSILSEGRTTVYSYPLAKQGASGLGSLLWVYDKMLRRSQESAQQVLQQATWSLVGVSVTDYARLCRDTVAWWYPSISSIANSLFPSYFA
jgi:hypothetical protein